MAKSPEELAHIEWLGYVQPVGLVVSIPAMLEAQCYVNKNIMAEHARFLNCLARDSAGNVKTEIRDLREFVQSVLGWESDDLISLPDRGRLPSEHTDLEVVLPQYHETLRPTHVVPEFNSSTDESSASKSKYVLLIQELAAKVDLDEPLESDSAKHWNASPQAKFERLLREAGVPIGLLFNRSQFRLVYAPRGETSGYATFNVDEMAQVAGRPMFAALHMLLGVERLFSLADKQRLPYILENSRKYQNTVSTALAEQVTSALFELLRGFQAANDQRVGELLQHVLANNPQHVYHGLLTVLMRLVFVLYAEDRDLVSSDPTYTNHYSVSGLFERLRSEAGRFPDTMDQRFGAWAQLLTLFRLVYEGGQHAELKIPARKGYLFDPNRYPFLEGRFDDGKAEISSVEEQSSAIQIPHISDGVIYRVLEDLLILDGERLSYRTLDVEQIGSVYEAIMGFELQVSAGKSIAIKPVKSHGAPATINLEALLAAKPADRAKLLNEWTDQKLGAGDAAAIKDATSIDELVAALDKKIAKHVTPGIVPADSMVFQPSDERRRSGSHYTPRSLTQPIVRTTLEPILKQMYDPEAPLPKVYEPTREDKLRYTAGELEARVRLSKKHIAATEAARAVGCAHPWQILELKVCDPAMGSGAFLVETCRQLGDELIKAWYAHDMIPADIPPDEDEVLYARRTIAQRCLYGVDKNIMAVDLAKLSLWLVTLAKDHPFTFLDHALRHGDSLVGLTREQIIGFHWEPKKQKKFGEDLIQKRLDKATASRAKILNAREDVAYRDQQQEMKVADDALDLIRLVGNACVSCFFDADKNKAREEELERVFGFASSYFSSIKTNNNQPTANVDFQSRAALQTAADRLKAGPHPVPCFHWEIEFPEVFSRENGGFDFFVGNPPFLGGARIWANLGAKYPDWVREVHSNSTGKAVDLIAHFFRRTFNLIRKEGGLGLIATNTIAQGDSREAGLRQICLSGGTVYRATRRLQWPGQAAVIICVVNVRKGKSINAYLDGKKVDGINSYLFPRATEFAPKKLKANENCCFRGCDIYGQGFVFSDEEASNNTSPVDLMHTLVAEDPRNASVIFPYIGGKEINSHPHHLHHRYVVNFGQMSLEEAMQWPKLIELIEKKVKPERDTLGGYSVAERRRDYWWQYGTYTPALYKAIKGSAKVLAISQTTKYIQFCFLPSKMVFSHKLLVMPVRAGHRDFALLQSRVHEIWALFLGSSMKDDPVYSPPDCFETFPFPTSWNCNSQLEETGDRYYAFRANLLVQNNEGLTETYNRFHSPDASDSNIAVLRRLHCEMDMAVLRAYGWDDLVEHAAEPNFCQFLLDYEEDEDDTASDSSSARQKKKPWRYRWPDDFHDEVLARLLELNEQRHKEELLLVKGKSTEPKPAKEPSKKPAKATPLLDGLDEATEGSLTFDDRMTLAITAAWGNGKLLDRLLYGQAVILWRNDQHRRFLADIDPNRQKRLKRAVDLKQLIGQAVKKGWITTLDRNGVEFIKLIVDPSPIGQLTSEESNKIDEIKTIVEKEKSLPDSKIIVTEDSLHATAPFV